MSQQINLFNPLFLKQKKYFSSLAMVQGLALLAMGIALAYGYIDMQRKALAQRTEEVGRMHAVQQERFNKLSAGLSPDAAAQAIELELKELEKQIAARQAMIAQLQAGGAQATAGYSAFLRAFARQTLNGLWLTGIHVDHGGQQLTVKGRALQADLLPVYIQQLGREGALKGRPFEKLELARREFGVASEGKPAPAFVEFSLVSSAESGGGAMPVERQPEQGKVN